MVRARCWLSVVSLLVLLVTSFAANAGGPPLSMASARPERIKQLRDSKVKTALGLPTFTFGRGYSTISNKWTPPFRVSPPVEGWVTDSGEADDSAYRVRLAEIRFPDGTRRSLYTPAQKQELFKNLIGHLYLLSGKRLDQALGLAENRALFQRFDAGIDGPGFDFPFKIRAPR